MKKWAATMLCGLVLVAGFLWARPDLRGWTPTNWVDPATRVTSTRAGGAPFLVGDCLPGTIDPHDLPTIGDGAGAASMSILTCRSRSSAIRIMLIYLAVVLTLLGTRAILRARRVRH